MDATIVRKQEQEITGIGAAIAAGLHVKYWSNLDQVDNMINIDREFKPDMNIHDRKKKRDRWAQAVQHSFGFGW